MKTKIKTEKAMSVIATITTVIALIIIGGVVALSPTQTTAQQTIRLYDGNLIKSPSSPDVYIVKYINGKHFKRLILNPDIFNSYGHLSWDNIKVVDDATIHQRHTTSHLVMQIHPDGTPVNGRVYYLTSAHNADTGIKHHLNVTPQEFESLGLDWDSIYKINSTEAGPTFYRTGTPMTVSNFNAVIRGATDQTSSTTTPSSDDSDDEDTSFRATLSTNITNIEIGENEQKEIAEFTLRSSDGDSTIDDMTLLFSPRGGASKNKNLSDTFTDIELLLGGTVIKRISTTSSAVIRQVGTNYQINFNLIPDTVIEEDTTEQLTVRAYTKTTLTDNHFQEWSISMEDIDLKGTYEETYTTAASRIFTVAKKKVSFVEIDDDYNQYLIGHNNQVFLNPNDSKNVNLLVASLANKRISGETDRTIILDSLQVRINPPNTRYIAENIRSLSLYTGSRQIGQTHIVSNNNSTSTFQFSNLNLRIQANATQIITVRANIQPHATATSTDITTTIPGTGIQFRYDTAGGRLVENGFIAGTAQNTVDLMITRPDSITTTFLSSPANPHITTKNLTDVGILQINVSQNAGTIHQLKIGLESQGASVKPYDIFKQMNILVDGKTYTKDLTRSSAYTQDGTVYTVSFYNLSIPFSRGANKNITVQLQTISDPTKSSTQEWQLSIPNQGIKATSGAIDQYSTSTPTKNFIVGDSIYSTLGQNNPVAQTFSAQQSNNKVELLEFKVTNHSTTDHTLDSFKVHLTGNTLGTNKTLNDIIQRIYLIENNQVIRTIANTSSLSPTTSTEVLFENLSKSLARGTEKTFTIAIDVPQQSTNYSYSSGSRIRASLMRINLANDTTSLSSTFDGNWMTFIKAGVVSFTKHAAPDNMLITHSATHEVAEFTLSVDGETVEIENIDVLLSKVSGYNNNPWDIISRIDLYDGTTRIGYLSLNSKALTDNRVSFIAPIKLSTPLSLRQINPRTITVKIITKKLIDNQWDGTWDVRLRSLGATSDKATFTLYATGLSNLQVWTTSTTAATLQWFPPASNTDIHGYEIEYCDVTNRTSCAQWYDVLYRSTSFTPTKPRLTTALTSQSRTALIDDLDATKVYRFRVRYTQTNPTRYSVWSTSQDIRMATHTTAVAPIVSDIAVSTINPPTPTVVHLEWTKEPDTTYQVRYCKGSRCNRGWIETRLFSRTIGSSTIQAIFTGLNQGTTYGFQVRAVQNNRISSDWSRSVSATTQLNSLLAIQATTTAEDITLTWDKVPGIVDTTNLVYEIEVCRPDIVGSFSFSHCSENDWELIHTTSTSTHETQYTFDTFDSEALTQNTSYDIRIRAVRDDTRSQWRVRGNVVTQRSVVSPTLQLSTIEPPATNMLVIEWDSVQSARYKAQYCSPSIGDTCTNREWITADNAIVHTISQRPGVAKLNLRSLTPGTRYNVRVKTTLNGSESTWSTILKTKTKLSTPTITPALTRIDTTDGLESITVFWTRSIGADAYEVQWCEYNCPTTTNEWQSITDSHTTMEIDISGTGVRSGKRYKVRIQAQTDVAGLEAPLTPQASEWSSPITVTIP